MPSTICCTAGMTDADIAKLKTDLKSVFYYIKYARNDDMLRKVIFEDESFRSMRRPTAEMLNEVTNSNLEIPTGEERIDVCKAIQDMREKDIAFGETRGETRGIIKGRINTFSELVKDGMLASAQASERMGMPEEQFMEKMKNEGVEIP